MAAASKSASALIAAKKATQLVAPSGVAADSAAGGGRPPSKPFETQQQPPSFGGSSSVTIAPRSQSQVSLTAGEAGPSASTTLAASLRSPVVGCAPNLHWTAASEAFPEDVDYQLFLKEQELIRQEQMVLERQKLLAEREMQLISRERENLSRLKEWHRKLDASLERARTSRVEASSLVPRLETLDAEEFQIGGHSGDYGAEDFLLHSPLDLEDTDAADLADTSRITAITAQTTQTNSDCAASIDGVDAYAKRSDSGAGSVPVAVSSSAAGGFPRGRVRQAVARQTSRPQLASSTSNRDLRRPHNQGDTTYHYRPGVPHCRYAAPCNIRPPPRQRQQGVPSAGSNGLSCRSIARKPVASTSPHGRPSSRSRSVQSGVATPGSPPASSRYVNSSVQRLKEQCTENHRGRTAVAPASLAASTPQPSHDYCGGLRADIDVAAQSVSTADTSNGDLRFSQDRSKHNMISTPKVQRRATSKDRSMPSSMPTTSPPSADRKSDTTCGPDDLACMQEHHTPSTDPTRVTGLGVLDVLSHAPSPAPSAVYRDSTSVVALQLDPSLESAQRIEDEA
eukprot:TRINITY_DN19891_c0_g1_i2.p1 TRINITY_DN19891_c0_g1~~TRINITY_DN19891_c0_g1_i2.p1  ORF type:complete len:567 (-),score=66.88 TRINITY_DN19891_c0_g1_i2:31-1731(-)